MSQQVNQVTTIQVRIHPELHRRLKIEAAKNGKTIGRLIEEEFGFIPPRKSKKRVHHETSKVD